MTRDALDADEDPVRSAAHTWIVRMHGPDAADSTAPFEAWLAEDPTHRDAYRDLTAQWERTKFLTHTRTGQARDLASVAVWYRRPGARGAAVAMVAVLVVVGLLFIRLPARPEATPTIAYATGVGEIRTIRLQDGTKVTLDAASSVKISIGAVAREVRLDDGLARFDVTPDPARAFVVFTSKGTITAKDAMFDVTATPALVRVTALRGALSFKGRQTEPGLGSPASFAIDRGQRLSLDGARADLNATRLSSPDWTTGMLSFDNERLADAVLEINRHNVRKVVLTDPSLADLRITGAFHAADAGGFARTIAAMLGLALHERAGGTFELSRKK